MELFSAHRPPSLSDLAIGEGTSDFLNAYFSLHYDYLIYLSYLLFTTTQLLIAWFYRGGN
jgi:hypothetical protein